MRREATEDRVLPPGWVERLSHEADLKASWAELRGRRNFYAEAMRGLVRSLEVKPRAAETRFRRALVLSDREPKTISNLVRQVLLNGFWIDNKALDGTIESVQRVEPLEFPEFPPCVVREYPEIQLVNNVRLSVDGTLRLYWGEWDRAVELFQEILARSGGRLQDVVATAYLGIASAEYNLGREDVARRHLECAGLAIQAGGTTLHRARVASNLAALYLCLGAVEAARDWARFLTRLECPVATKAAFFKRVAIIRERWDERPILLPI